MEVAHGEVALHAAVRGAEERAADPRVFAAGRHRRVLACTN